MCRLLYITNDYNVLIVACRESLLSGSEFIERYDRYGSVFAS